MLKTTNGFRSVLSTLIVFKLIYYKFESLTLRQNNHKTIWGVNHNKNEV